MCDGGRWTRASLELEKYKDGRVTQLDLRLCLHSSDSITMHASILLSILAVGLASAAPAEVSATKRHNNFAVQVGDRPYFLIDDMDDGSLKRKLESCKNQDSKISKFTIGHRGAPLMYPEHTVESYNAAARQGAGTIECDVAFTKDKKLVCRHDQ